MAERWVWRKNKRKSGNRIFETVAQFLIKGNKINHLTPKIEDTSLQYIQPKKSVYNNRQKLIELLI